MLCRWLAQFQGQIIHRAGGHVRVLHIDIGHLAVAPGHLQAGVSQEALQAEHVAAVYLRVCGEHLILLMLALCP